MKQILCSDWLSKWERWLRITNLITCTIIKNCVKQTEKIRHFSTILAMEFKKEQRVKKT